MRIWSRITLVLVLMIGGCSLENLDRGRRSEPGNEQPADPKKVKESERRRADAPAVTHAQPTSAPPSSIAVTGSDRRAVVSAGEQGAVLDSLGYLGSEGMATPVEEPKAIQDLRGRREERPEPLTQPDPEPAPDSEDYARLSENPFLDVSENPLSTFSIDVDTASYSNTRRFLEQGRLPPADAVRIEELINYFDYDYPAPRDENPFSTSVEVTECPWNWRNRLVRVGLKGKEIEAGERPPSNLVFLLDVSGSMNSSNKLPLLKSAFSLLVSRLDERDRIAIVVYAGASGLVLPSTPAHRRDVILSALERLGAGGSTNGGAGIELAYRVAEENFVPGGVNRVLLATDGDFNVGTTGLGGLERLIQDKARSGVFLTVLGFGMGNYKDAQLETLADKGNGNYGYIDTLPEARKLLVEQLSGTLITIAKDVKIQIEWNPARVGAYRLIGYENRLLEDRDFNDDTKDAGEIGAGHTVTALYEIVPSESHKDSGAVDPLRYQAPRELTNAAAATDELMVLKLRYKQPDGEKSKLMEFPVRDEGSTLAQSSGDLKFAAAVAGFGMLLRNSTYKGQFGYDAVLELADEGRGRDPNGYRTEFLRLARLARDLHPR